MGEEERTVKYLEGQIEMLKDAIEGWRRSFNDMADENRELRMAGERKEGKNKYDGIDG